MNEELFNKPIGNKEIKKLEAKEVIVLHTEVKEKGVKKQPILELAVKHPDQEEALILTKIQYIDGKEIKTAGLWISLDEDGNIQKGSALTRLMMFYKIKTLMELKDLKVQTCFDEKNYLVIKAY